MLNCSLSVLCCWVISEVLRGKVSLGERKSLNSGLRWTQSQCVTTEKERGEEGRGDFQEVLSWRDPGKERPLKENSTL